MRREGKKEEKERREIGKKGERGEGRKYWRDERKEDVGRERKKERKGRHVNTPLSFHPSTSPLPISTPHHIFTILKMKVIIRRGGGKGKGEREGGRGGDSSTLSYPLCWSSIIFWPARIYEDCSIYFFSAARFMFTVLRRNSKREGDKRFVFPMKENGVELPSPNPVFYFTFLCFDYFCFWVIPSKEKDKMKRRGKI